MRSFLAVLALATSFNAFAAAELPVADVSLVRIDNAKIIKRLDAGREVFDVVVSYTASNSCTAPKQLVRERVVQQQPNGILELRLLSVAEMRMCPMVYMPVRLNRVIHTFSREFEQIRGVRVNGVIAR